MREGASAVTRRSSQIARAARLSRSRPASGGRRRAARGRPVRPAAPPPRATPACAAARAVRGGRRPPPRRRRSSASRSSASRCSRLGQQVHQARGDAALRGVAGAGQPVRLGAAAQRVHRLEQAGAARLDGLVVGGDQVGQHRGVARLRERGRGLGQSPASASRSAALIASGCPRSRCPRRAPARVAALVALHLLVHPLDDLLGGLLADEPVEERHQRLGLRAEADGAGRLDDVRGARCRSPASCGCSARSRCVRQPSNTSTRYLRSGLAAAPCRQRAAVLRSPRSARLVHRPLDQLAAELVRVQVLRVHAAGCRRWRTRPRASRRSSA